MKRIAALVLVVAAVGCKKKSSQAQPPPAASDGGAAVVADGDAGVADPDPDDLPDEASVRAGKRTGLEAPDSKPEVATEALARALVGGVADWKRFIDPAVGVVVLRALPPADTAPAILEVERRCAGPLDEALAAFAGTITAAFADPALAYDVACDNTGLAVTVPGVASNAVCTVSSPAGGVDHDLVFVPDPARGLRLIGLASADATATDDALLDRFDEEMGRYGAKCP